MSNQLFKDHWDRKRQAASTGQTRIDVSRAGAAIRLQVSCPYDQAFIKAAHALSGSWRPRTKMWTFPLRAYPLLLPMCKQVYGEENVTVTGLTHLVE